MVSCTKMSLVHIFFKKSFHTHAFFIISQTNRQASYAKVTHFAVRGDKLVIDEQMLKLFISYLAAASVTITCNQKVCHFIKNA